MSKNDCLTEQEITLYCSEDLEFEPMRKAADHFASCADCRSKMESIKQTLSALPQHRLEMSEAEKLQFANRVMQATRKKHHGPRLQAWGAAATAITAGVVAVMVFTPSNLPTRPDQNQALQYAELDLVENMDMLESMELLEMMEMLEILEDKG